MKKKKIKCTQCGKEGAENKVGKGTLCTDCYEFYKSNTFGDLF